MINEILEYQPEKENLWNGEYKIPWHERGFSERMLKMHLSQAHDMASRRKELIEKQVKWINSKILKNQSSKILDLGCGPGLYIKALTELDHDCTGIDFSPASIEYARQNCKNANLVIKDIRDADYGKDFDLAMLLFGEVNVFSPQECLSILGKMHASLKPGGVLLLEVHLLEAVKRMGKAPKSWFRTGGNTASSDHWFDNVMDDGLFSKNPHIALVENNWLEEEKIALSNFWVLEDSKDLSHYVSTTQAYTDQEYLELLEAANFKNITMHDDFGETLTPASDFQVVSATNG